MSLSYKWIKWITLLMSFGSVGLFYMNCGKGFRGEIKLESDYDELGMPIPGQCDEYILKAFNKSYYPFLTKNCSYCHNNPTKNNAIGSFASSNLADSFSAFLERGEDRIYNNSTHNHASFPAGRFQPEIDNIHDFFGEANENYLICVKESQKGLVTKSLKLESLTKSEFRTLSWDLENEILFGPKIPAVFSVEAKIYQGNPDSELSGYEFKNPTIKAKGNSDDIILSGVRFIFNDILDTTFTSYASINAKLPAGTDKLNLLPENEGSNGVAFRIPNKSDLMAIQFDDIYAEKSESNPPPSEIDGAKLYGDLGCANCHNSIGMSEHRNTTRAKFDRSITNNLGGMAQYSNLTSEQRDAIVKALKN